MIAYLKGPITFKSPTFIEVEAGGVGYHVNISLHTYARIEPLEVVKILTYLHVKEDAQTLYGFFDDTERSLFKLLISVSGIGLNTAQVLQSSLTPDEVRSAIISEDVRTFNKVKGIGPKTAKRIILDLKDKVMKDSGDIQISTTPANNTLRDEALSALVALGFQRIKVQKTLNAILRQQTETTTVETLIKLALKQLS